MPRMHADELEIDEALVRRLLRERFPEWADRSLHRVQPDGTDNAIFRLGEDLAVRLPRREARTEPGGTEAAWLPRLASQLSRDIPVPVAQGAPPSEDPCYWDVNAWDDGATVGIEAIDAIDAAKDLAVFVAGLQRVDPTDAPSGRGVPLAERDPDFRYWLARYQGDPKVVVGW